MAAVIWVVVLVMAAILFGDRAVVGRIERAGPSIVAMTLAAFGANHVLKFVRWQWMLLGIGGLPQRRAAGGCDAGWRGRLAEVDEDVAHGRAGR